MRKRLVPALLVPLFLFGAIPPVWALLQEEVPVPESSGTAEPSPEESEAPEILRVLFAGYGWPEESFDYAYGNLLEFLRFHGVVLRKDPEDSEPDRMNANAFEFFRRNLREFGVDSILYMRLDSGERQVDRLVLRCFDENGEYLWEEITAGMMSLSYYGSVRALTKRMKKKLLPHIGKAGLPVEEGFSERIGTRKGKR